MDRDGNDRVGIPIHLCLLAGVGIRRGCETEERKTTRECVVKIQTRSTTSVGRFLAAGVLLTISVSATAQEGEAMEPQFPQQQTARDLLRACASSRLTATGRERRRYCAGFVSGVEEAIRLLNLGGKSRFRLCTPDDISTTALADAFLSYGASHEAELDDPAASVVHHALTLAYPCGDSDE